MIVCAGAGRTVPREVRERLAPDAARTAELLSRVPEGLGELMVLSTCHRVELYATAESPDHETLAHLTTLLDPENEVGSDLNLFAGVEATRHLFRVTAGLDSLVPGEPQIQAQVRRALYESRKHGAAGSTLANLVSRALRTGRRARRETSLGAIGESLGTATARVLEERLGRLDGRQGLVVGAGEAAEDAAIALRARGAYLRVASRNPGHAQALAARLDAERASIDDLAKLIEDAAFVVVAVAGGELLTDVGASTAVLVDLSMPHAIAPGLGAITVDELPPPQGATVTTGIAEATALIDAEIAALARWAEGRHETGAAIRALRGFADDVVRSEVARMAQGPEDAARLAEAAERVAAKLLHAPLRALRDADPETASWLSDLLGLNGPDSPPSRDRGDFDR